MGTQVVEVHAESTAPPADVWRLLIDATTWPEWSGFDEARYEREGSPPPHGVGAVRRFKAGRLWARDTVLEVDEPEHLAYTYEGSLPIKDYRADVRLAARETGTRISWHAEFAPKYPLTGALLRLGLTRVLGDISRRLAEAAEREAGPAGEAS